jgi:SPP1 family predicted phage head-tail adaptor
VSGEAATPPLGTLTDRLQLMRRTTIDEAEGGEIAVFSPLATVWGRVRALAARAALESDARGVAITHSVVIRFRSDLGPGDRVVYRGAVLEVVKAADLNGRRAYLSCQCTERAVTG